MPSPRRRPSQAWQSLTEIVSLRWTTGRFTGLTIVLFILVLSSSVVRETDLRELITGLGMSVLLLFAIRSVGRRLRVVTVTVAVPTFVSHWALHLSTSFTLRCVSFAFTSVFLIFLTLVIVFAVFRDRSVTADTIVGAICAYFLLGVTWGTLYSLVVLLSPNALLVSSTLAAAAGWAPPTSPLNPVLEYYSFTTLATLGYGDVTPLTAPARILSVMEGLTGQLYLAVLIARLVGMHTARTAKD